MFFIQRYPWRWSILRPSWTQNLLAGWDTFSYIRLGVSSSLSIRVDFIQAAWSPLDQTWSLFSKLRTVWDIVVAYRRRTEFHTFRLYISRVLLPPFWTLRICRLSAMFMVRQHCPLSLFCTSLLAAFNFVGHPCSVAVQIIWAPRPVKVLQARALYIWHSKQSWQDGENTKGLFYQYDNG